jgi:hypothetical protein
MTQTPVYILNAHPIRQDDLPITLYFMSSFPYLSYVPKYTAGHNQLEFVLKGFIRNVAKITFS